MMGVALTLLGTVFVASLLGSLHCAGMCGGLVALAVTPNARPRGTLSLPVARVPQLHVAYHAGRLAAYVALGVIAGALGAALQKGGLLVGFQHTAGLVAGTLMIVLALLGVIAALDVFGVAGLARVRSDSVGAAAPATEPERQRRAATGVRAALARLHVAAAAWPALPRSAAIGGLSALLPCGWLYMFVLAAAGTGQMLLGGLVMAAFWAGSVPILVGVGASVQLLRQAVGRHVPLAMSLLLLVVGVWTVWGRVTLPPLIALDRAAAAAPAPDALSQVHTATETAPPCCHSHAP